MAQSIALTHHERWDGTGYPHSLKGMEIPVEGRIVAIADVFDALTTSRPYKEPFPMAKAVEIIKKEGGSHFDPRLVEVFLDALPEMEELASEG
jgi:putative two-component system response regulator